MTTEFDYDTYMTYRDLEGLVHYVHGTPPQFVQTLCGVMMSHIPCNVTDSDRDPPTCFWCVLPHTLLIRPPFDKTDARYHDKGACVHCNPASRRKAQ